MNEHDDDVLRNEWRALGAQPGAGSEVLREVRRAERQERTLRRSELSAITGLIGIVGYAVLAGPGITDAVWTAGTIAALGLGAAVALATRRRGTAPLPADTTAFLDAFCATASRRLRILRAGRGVLVVESVAFVPFLVWRYRVNPGSVLSHHGVASWVGTLLLLALSGIWIRARLRDARTDLERCRALRAGLDAA